MDVGLYIAGGFLIPTSPFKTNPPLSCKSMHKATCMLKINGNRTKIQNTEILNSGYTPCIRVIRPLYSIGLRWIDQVINRLIAWLIINQSIPVSFWTWYSCRACVLILPEICCKLQTLTTVRNMNSGNCSEAMLTFRQANITFLINFILFQIVLVRLKVNSVHLCFSQPDTKLFQFDRNNRL